MNSVATIAAFEAVESLGMMLSSLITIGMLHWAVLLVPGFNFILIGRLAAGGKGSTALAAVAGMTSATLAWATLAVMGIGIVFALHPVIRHFVQIFGGLYLLHLAFRLWSSGQAPTSSASELPSDAGAFRIGFITSAFNPKIALFYGSVFATALPATPSAVHVLSAVALVYLNSVVWHTFLAWAMSRSTIQQAYLRHYARFNRLASILVGAFGLRLLVSTLQELRANGA